MYIHIEANRGLKLILTTPSTANVKKTARLGASSWTPEEFKSTPVDAYSNSPQLWLGACDISKEVCAEPSGTSTPSRSGSIRKTFRWLYIHFSWPSHPKRNKSACRSYQHQERSKPDFSTAQKLPDKMPEMETPGMIPQELEAEYQRTFNIQNYAMDTSGALYPALYFGQSGKWSHAGMDYAYGQFLAPLQIPNHYPGWITGPHPQVDPGMITEGLSPKSSLISPDTPERESSFDTQSPNSTGFQGGSISPYYTASHGAGVYTEDGQSFHGTQGYSSSPAVSRPGDGSPVEMPASSPITISYAHPAHIPSGLNEPYQEMGQETFKSQGFGANPGSLNHVSKDHFDSTQQSDDSRWFCQRTHVGGVEGDHLQVQKIFNEPQQALDHGDNGQHQSLPQEGSITATQVKSYPPVTCGQCGTQFNGRYGKGNLKRHFNRFHNLFKSMVGMTCRQCRKEFKRGDAARKHERTVHGYADVMTTPRRRGKAPAAMY